MCIRDSSWIKIKTVNKIINTAAIIVFFFISMLENILTLFNLQLEKLKPIRIM